jgi:hypothetical protein
MKRWLGVSVVLLAACSGAAERGIAEDSTGVARGSATSGTATRLGADRGRSWESRGIGGGGALYGPSINPFEGYPFRQPYRVFFNPYDDRETWVTSFGGGMRVMTER